MSPVAGRKQSDALEEVCLANCFEDFAQPLHPLLLAPLATSQEALIAPLNGIGTITCLAAIPIGSEVKSVSGVTGRDQLKCIELHATCIDLLKHLADSLTSAALGKRDYR